MIAHKHDEVEPDGKKNPQSILMIPHDVCIHGGHEQNDGSEEDDILSHGQHFRRRSGFEQVVTSSLEYLGWQQQCVRVQTLRDDLMMRVVRVEGKDRPQTRPRFVDCHWTEVPPPSSLYFPVCLACFLHTIVASTVYVEMEVRTTRR